jgi:hypothetical protein
VSAVRTGELFRELGFSPPEDPRRPKRLRRLRLVERMDRLAIDGGGAVSPQGPEHGDAVPNTGGGR